jgi:hypothetical protein
MPKYEVVLSDGQSLPIEHTANTAKLVVEEAAKANVLATREVVSLPGRDPRLIEIAIPYHAILLVRPRQPS